MTAPRRHGGAAGRPGHYVHRITGALAQAPERTVLTGSGLSLTAGQFARSIAHVASLLTGHGAGPGSTVAILTEANHPHMLTIRYAAHLVGAAAVYIRSNNARSDEGMLPVADQARMLAETGARLLVTDAASYERGREACRGLPCEVARAGLEDAARLADAGGLSLAPGLPAAGYDADSRLVVTYTSGSTGRPKGVCHSYRAWNSMAAGFEAVVRGATPPRLLAVTPVGQTVGVMLDGTLAAGGSAVLHERFSLDRALHAFAELGVTDCYLAVPHLYALAEDPRTARLDLGRLRNVIYSGSPAAPHRIAAAAGVFGHALLQSYGSTEAGGISYLGSWEHRDPELLPTVGRPYPGVRVRVCEGRPDRELPAGATGEVWVRSGSIMEGYLGDATLNAEVLRDGWLRTGDLGCLSQRGYLRLTGRIGNSVKNRGLKVYPDTIERTLLDHPDVTGAAVIGIRCRHDYEEAYAAVTLRPGAGTTLGGLRDHVSAALSPDHVPAIWAHWAALPADDAGKTDRRRLAALVEAETGPAHGLLAEEQL